MKNNYVYNNIFHYFKGSSNQHEHELQFENNATKALINVLQHSTPKITTGFLQLVNEYHNLQQHETYTYALQVGSKLENVAKTALVLGIAEERTIMQETSKQRNSSIPDAAIISEDFALLIETKIGHSSKLSKEQLEHHYDKFHDKQKNIETPLILTWKEIRRHFAEVEKQYDPNSISHFLLKQFDEFCEINGLGGTSHEHHFLKLPLASRDMAKQIDSYIWSTYHDVFEPPQTKRGIAYKRERRRAGFGKLCTDRKCLILRYGSKGSLKGLEMQEKVDRVFGKSFERKGRDITGYTHETYIDYQVVTQLDNLIPFIHSSYQETP